mmetsp:Transcript_89781/g.269842  ORF Transcript_89781/g.269842 Transcript_89781/m.269842 type:complete len:217 (-) Transcript_89781:204-854(-)
MLCRCGLHDRLYAAERGANALRDAVLARQGGEGGRQRAARGVPRRRTRLRPASQRRRPLLRTPDGHVPDGILTRDERRRRGRRGVGRGRPRDRRRLDVPQRVGLQPDGHHPCDGAHDFDPPRRPPRQHEGGARRSRRAAAAPRHRDRLLPAHTRPAGSRVALRLLCRVRRRHGARGQWRHLVAWTRSARRVSAGAAGFQARATKPAPVELRAAAAA